MMKMFKTEEPLPEILIPVLDINTNEEELNFSIREEENFHSFRSFKDSTNCTTQSSRQKPLIRRVPTILTENENFNKYFEPRVVAIGPLHHGNTRLQSAEKTKLKLAVLFTKEHGVAEQILYKKIKEEIEHLRESYKTKDIEVYDDEELAWMLFVDGCAVLHAIHNINPVHEKPRESLDHVKIDLLAFAQVDLFMLENQIPFRVLELLMNSIDNGKALRESIYAFIDDKIKRTLAEGDTKTKPYSRQDKEPVHLLDLLRERLLTKPDDKATNTTIGNILMSLGSNSKPQHVEKTFRTINELKEAGIQLSPSSTSSLRDVSFGVGFLGTLNIPRIVVDDSTGSKFMNLVAYEMCPDFKNDFGVTSYLCFLDTLIDTARDVKELRHAGMLLNYMGSDEEVAHLFNKITTDLVPDTEMYQQVTNDIRKYCDNPFTTSIARFYHTHFSTPWSIGAFFSVVMGLVFTAVQTYYTMQKKVGEPKYKG